MKARDIMIQQVYAAKSTDLVRDVLRQFSVHHIGGMPIIDESRHVVGYISDGDIMRSLGKHYGMALPPYLSVGMYYVGTEFDDVALEFSDVLKSQVEFICSQRVMDLGRRKVICVSPDDDIVHVADLLARKNIKKVPVIHHGKLIGIVSRGDVVRAIVNKYLPSSSSSVV